MIAERLEARVVDFYTGHYKLQPRGTLLDRAISLESHFEVLKAGNRIEQLAQCDQCEGKSDARLPACPFCGDGAPVEAAETKEITVTPVEPATELDKVLEELAQCARVHRSNIYRTGCLLRRIRDEELWQQRVDGEGKQLYSGYLEFVKVEVKIKRAWASRLVSLVEQFSEQQFEEWGATRLYLSSKLPVDERQKALEAGKGQSTREFEETVRDRSRSSQGNPWPKLESTQKSMQSVPLGRVTTRLYARPTKEGPVNAPTEEAQGIEQQPFGMVQITENLWARITIKRSVDGTGVLVAGFELRTGSLVDSDGKRIEDNG